MIPEDAIWILELIRNRDARTEAEKDAVNAAIEALKAQLFSESTTSDLISKTEVVKHLRRMLESTVPNTDYDEGFVDGVEFGVSTVSTMPTIQPQSTAGRLNDGAQSTARSTDLIDRRAAIDAVEKNACNTQRIMDAVNNLPPAQPEHKVRFADKDHVWIDGKQYISLPRFQEAVKEAQSKEGHWIEVAGELECSECHTVFTDLYPDYADSVACPHCGAKMKGEPNEAY